MSRSIKMYAKYHKRRQYLPQIKLQGVWLEQAGFKPDDRITVEVRARQIIINKTV